MLLPRQGGAELGLFMKREKRVEVVNDNGFSVGGARKAAHGLETRHPLARIGHLFHWQCFHALDPIHWQPNQPFASAREDQVIGRSRPPRR